ALRGAGSAGYLGLTRREASLTKWRHIQQELLESGAVITDLRDDFHTYENWTYFEKMIGWDKLPTRRVPGAKEAWYRSALIRLELLEEPRCPQEELQGDIFNDSEAATT
ncbi:MAG: bis-aminopropyl spermidine synthase family protein, partial [Candidatus Bipolaricaulota bacterium]